MASNFFVGEFDFDLGNETGGGQTKGDEGVRVRVGKFGKCGVEMGEYIPCLDNLEAVSGLNSAERGEKYERHCPEKGRGLDCLIPRPDGYKPKIPWPKSRDEVWFNNVPHTHLVEDKGGQNWISRKNDKFEFPGGGTQFIHGANQYLDQISEIVCRWSLILHLGIILELPWMLAVE